MIPRRVLQFNKLWTRTSFDLYFVFDAKTIKKMGLYQLKNSYTTKINIKEIYLSKFAAMVSLLIFILRGLTGIGGGVGLAGVHD